MPCFGKMAKIKPRKKEFNFSFTKTFSIVSKIHLSLWIKSLCQKVDLRIHIKKQPALGRSREPVNCAEAVKCQSSILRELTLFIKPLCSWNPSDCVSPGSEWRHSPLHLRPVWWREGRRRRRLITGRWRRKRHTIFYLLKKQDRRVKVKYRVCLSLRPFNVSQIRWLPAFSDGR